MIPCAQIGRTLKHLTAAYSRVHGPEALLPRRKEPFEPRRNAEFRSLPHGTPLGSRRLDWNAPFFVMIWAVLTLAGCAGFRKAEVTVPSGTTFSNLHLSRAHLLWRIGGVTMETPTAAQLRGLVKGDYALIRPPPSKTDPFGTIFGTNMKPKLSPTPPYKIEAI